MHDINKKRLKGHFVFLFFFFFFAPWLKVYTFLKTLLTETDDKHDSVCETLGANQLRCLSVIRPARLNWCGFRREQT